MDGLRSDATHSREREGHHGRGSGIGTQVGEGNVIRSDGCYGEHLLNYTPQDACRAALGATPAGEGFNNLSEVE